MMSDFTNEVAVLELEKICNIKYEPVEKFETSVLRETYNEAFSITKEIVEENISLTKTNYDQHSTGTNRRNSEQIYNIIFFTGDRGTGKTSAMLSYMEFLKDYHRIKIKGKLPEGLNFGGTNIMFTGIEPIDASLLESKEDILSTVLSKMTGKWLEEERRSYGESGIIQDEDYSYKKRKMQKQFNAVYDCLKDLRSQEDIMKRDDDIFLDTLQKLAFTLNLKASFQTLVDNYLGIMEYSGSRGDIGKNDRYLVISIDDLDVEIEHSYKLLEQVRKYLMVPKVIVLMSANYEQLEKICWNHFMKQYKHLKKDDALEEYVERLSGEYLEKIVPIQRQVSLKSGREWKYFEKNGVKIQYRNSRSEEILQDGTLKDIVRKILNDYFGIQLGVNSSLLRYITPLTLRETATLIGQISELVELRQADKEQFEANFSWFVNREMPRLLKRNSRILDGNMLKALEQLSPEVQMNVIKESLKKNGYLKDEVSLMSNFSQMQKGDLAEQKESSMYMLYLGTQLSRTLQTDRIQEFLAYFDGGIWGKWENKFLGDFSKARPNTEGLLVEIARVEFAKTNEALTLELRLEDSYSTEDVEWILKYIERNKTQLVNYQYLLLFYSLDENISETKNMWIREEYNIKLNNEVSGIFALSNFILNIFSQCKLVKKFLKELPSILYTGEDERSREKIKNHIDENISIIKDIQKWAEKSENNLALPIYNTEYLLQVGDELKKIYDKAAVAEATQDILTLRIKRYFKMISDSLEKYDECYQENKCKEIFDNCPVTQRINNDSTFMSDLINSVERVVGIVEE